MQLTADDFAALEKSWIPRELAERAGLYRVTSIEGRERMGRGGDCEGVIYPYTYPGSGDVVAERLRLDHPPIDSRGRYEHKYLSHPGQRNHLYFPLAEPAWLNDAQLPVIITEGEKKGLALHRAALEAAAGANGSDRVPRFLAVALAGVWAWRGQVGIATNASGRRVPEKGVIADFDRIRWEGRRVFLCFDTNISYNDGVRAASRALAYELEGRGAQVWFLELPAGAEINGVDDFLACPGGLEAFLGLLGRAARYQWHDELVKSDKGKILPTFSNALTALRLAPAWHGVLAFNQSALRAEMRKPPPWGGEAGPWEDREDSLLIEWMERQGIGITDAHATRAALVISRERGYHPVRDYLGALKWDGRGRIDDWLTVYLGAEANRYTRAVGARWLISAIARAGEPGCQADHALILEGGQGAGKSTAFGILGGEFYSDDIAELGTKDASLGTAGVWIVELAELDAMGRSEVSRIKSFLSRRVDRFRPPYGRHLVWVPRQCVFGGTINLSSRYLKDETGGRRFWPVKCGELNLETLRRDRDQLWGEALARHQKGEHWWLDTAELVELAAQEQEERYQVDPWEGPIEKWLLGQTEVTTADALSGPLRKDIDQWTRTDEIRVGAILGRLGWEVAKRPNTGGSRRRIYREKLKT